MSGDRGSRGSEEPRQMLTPERPETVTCVPGQKEKQKRDTVEGLSSMGSLRVGRTGWGARRPQFWL